MARVKGGSASNSKRKRLFSITKGYWGRKKNVFRRAKEAFLRSMTNAFVTGKQRSVSSESSGLSV